MSSEVFASSEARFDLRRDQELLKKLDEIQRAIDKLREDFKQANAQLLEKLIWIQKTELHQQKYLQTIQRLIETQQEKEDLPDGWDVDKSLWENAVRQGTEHLGEWVFPRTTKLLKILDAVRAQRLLEK